MKKKALSAIAALCVSLSLCACGGNAAQGESIHTMELEETPTDETAVEEDVQDEKATKEEFIQQYELTMVAIDELNAYADYISTGHSIIWDNIGAKEVSKYIGYVRKYNSNDTLGEASICKAFGLSYLNGSQKKQALEYAERYVTIMNDLDSKIDEVDNLYKSTNSEYDFDISDLKEYYIEVSTYTDYAREIEGSYVTYTQNINDYKTNIERLKKAAEIAY